MDAKPEPSSRLIALLAVLCLAVASIGVTWVAWDMFGSAQKPMLQGWDDSYYYFWLPSAVIDHDLDFSNQLAGSGTVDPATRDLALTLPRTETGLLANKYPPGWALGSLPFFLVAHAIAPSGANGFEPTYLAAVWLGQLLYAIAGLWIATQILRRYFAPRIALAAVLAGWLVSPLVYYQTARLSMSHSQVFTLAMVIFWLSLRLVDGDRRPRIWLLLGLTSGLLVVTRNVAFIYLTVPAWAAWLTLRRPAHAVLLALGAAVPLSIQGAAWKALYGSWFAYSYGGERFDFAHLHLGGVLFSPFHGWFYWHPMMLVGVGAFAWWGWRRTEARWWGLSLGAIIVLDAAWPTWWLGSSFGHRGFEVPTLFAMLGIAWVWEKLQASPLGRRAWVTVLAVAIAWNIALFALFLTQHIPREAPVRYADVVHALGNWSHGRVERLGP